MYAAAPIRYHLYASQVRWLARLMAVVLFGVWTAYVVIEAIRSPFQWPLELYAQGAILAAVFIGYAVGWRREFVGGLLAILGTAAFYLMLALSNGFVPRDPNMIWFAVPGVLYLLARHYDRRSKMPAT